MKMIIPILIGVLSFGAFAAKEKPLVSIEKAKKTVFERTMFFPTVITSKVDSQIKSDGCLL